MPEKVALPEIGDGAEHWDLVPAVKSVIEYVKSLEERIAALESK